MRVRTVNLNADDEATLRHAFDAEMKAANDADARGWASLYAEDAIVLRPRASAIQGRNAIQAWLATFPPISNAKGDSVEVAGCGDLAYVRGSYRMTSSMPGAASTLEEQRKFLQVYRRHGNRLWKLSREIYNSDFPLRTSTKQ
jgi:uncharacterized protein (TIGR02246 family)